MRHNENEALKLNLENTRGKRDILGLLYSLVWIWIYHAHALAKLYPCSKF